MAILHVHCEQDVKPHELAVTGQCWCGPNILDEGVREDGYPALTVIHQRKAPVELGTNLGIIKTRLCAKNGEVLSIDRAPSRQTQGARPRLVQRQPIDNPAVHLPE